MEDLKEVPPFGIFEPTEDYGDGRGRRISAVDVGLDVLVVPGLGFDKQGGRLGRGKGYYDSFIQSCSEAADKAGRPRPQLIGLAYACQLVPGSVPLGSHDAKLDYVATYNALYDRRTDII